MAEGLYLIDHDAKHLVSSARHQTFKNCFTHLTTQWRSHMPTTKKASSKKSGKKAAAAVKSGPLPPYGVAIREAMARGNSQEMKALAASTRKYVSDVSGALAKLQSALKR
jgi:Domain of unknown function (DUF1843)